MVVDTFMPDSAISSISFPVLLIHELSAATTTQAALDVLASWLPELMESDRASIAVFSETRDAVEVLKLTGSSAIPSGTVLPIEGTIVGRACRDAEVINTPVMAGLGFADADQLASAGLGSCLNAPLVGGGVSFGSLNMARVSENGFTSNDEVLAASLGKVVGSTLRSLDQIERERKRARTDALTGLANRRAILDLLSERLERGDHDLCVLFIDLDDFKSINDAYGHAVGDEILMELADRFRACVEDDDIVGRLGGDEFVIICGTGYNETSARDLAHRLAIECSALVHAESVDVEPRLSIGLSAQTQPGDTVADLLAQADRAMYEAKRTGQTVVEVDERLRIYADLLGAIDRDLEGAMQRGEIQFLYQPIRDLLSGEVLGCEALLRWHHPDLGLVPSPLLVERAEATGRIDVFTAWALDEVARTWAAFRAADVEGADRWVAFNLSPRQLGWKSYVDVHMAALERHGLSSQDIVIEVVESGRIEVETTAEHTLRQLAENGVGIALDDYGTGHHVISYFSRFPIHCLKIDKSMVHAMDESAVVRILVKGLCRIAEDLGIRALGEGIETRAHLEGCIAAGVRVGQGFLLGSPMTIESLHEFVVAEAIAGQSDSPSNQFSGSSPALAPSRFSAGRTV